MDKAHNNQNNNQDLGFINPYEQNNQQPSMSSQHNNQENQPNNQENNSPASNGWAILGFIIPLVGLILFLVWDKGVDRPKGRKAGKGALISVILRAAILYIVLYIIYCFIVLNILK